MIDLRCGDCLDILPTIAGPFDAIITDLPYGTTACKWDTIIPFEPMWAQVKRLLKPRGAFVTTASQPFTSALVMSNLEWFKYDWAWHKMIGANFMNLSNQPFRVHESVLIFSPVADFTFNPIRTMRADSSLQRDPIGRSRVIPQKPTKAEHYDTCRVDGKPISADGMKHPTSLLTFSTREAGVVYQVQHPTKKPVALLEYLIRTYTNEGDTVLDFCMGSGTTMVACVNTGRHGVGIDILPEYVAIAERRVKEAQQQIALPMMEAAR